MAAALGIFLRTPIEDVQKNESKVLKPSGSHKIAATLPVDFAAGSSLVIPTCLQAVVCLNAAGGVCFHAAVKVSAEQPLYDASRCSQRSITSPET
jgi:hypothetical protein